MPISEKEFAELKAKAKQLRLDILDTVCGVGGGHIGGSMSFVEVMTLLYYKYMNINPAEPEWEDRDRFILSKGHAGIGFAPILADKGYFSKDELKTFNLTGSRLGMHMDGNKVPGVDASTGSLGHGLPMSAGLALGAKIGGKSWNTFCLLGDGECHEGTNWEAAMFIAHNKITNLITIVDRNMMMIDGPTEEVLSLEPFADKWAGFGFRVLEVDGHDLHQLVEAFDTALAENDKPCVIIAKTVKGKGIKHIEGDYRYHYGSFNSDDAEIARKSILESN